MRVVRSALSLGVAGFVTALCLSTGCSVESQVRQVFMDLDGTGDRVRDTFFTDQEKFYCNIVYSAQNADTTLDVELVQTTSEDPLFAGSGPLHQVERLWGVKSLPGGPPSSSVQIVAIEADPPTDALTGSILPFPVGDWQCRVYTNGVKAGESDFTIAYPSPDCPADDAASSGQPCAAYKLNETCPSTNNLQNTTACTCVGTDRTRTWSCQ